MQQPFENLIKNGMLRLAELSGSSCKGAVGKLVEVTGPFRLPLTVLQLVRVVFDPRCAEIAQPAAGAGTLAGVQQPSRLLLHESTGGTPRITDQHGTVERPQPCAYSLGGAC